MRPASGLAIVTLLLTGWPVRGQLHNSHGAPVLIPMDTRAQIASDILAHQPTMKAGAELGVQLGFFVEHTLKHWTHCERFYVVDAWQEQSNYLDNANLPQDQQEHYYQEAIKRLQPWHEKLVVLRNWTSDAHHAVPNNSLDYLYVDARHDYCGVMQDLQEWWPKLRAGGLMCGHDYMYAAEVGKDTWELCGDGSINPGAVRGAVNDFMVQHGMQVVVTLKDEWPTWCALKPQQASTAAHRH